MHTLINGSQKLKNSNSKYFLEYIGNELNSYKLFNLKDNNFDDIVSSINQSENIVIASPLYADSPNTITIKFLNYIYDNKITINKNIYIIINCGFREGEQNITALNILKNWCQKVQANYSGSILIGAGEVAGNPKYKWLSTKIFKTLNKLSNDIKNNHKSPEYIATINLLNNSLYCLAANISWNKSAKKNGLQKNEVRNK